MKLVKLMFGLSVLGLLAYATFGVPLGRKTLWQHLGAIASAPQTQELVEGFESTVSGLWSGDDDGEAESEARAERGPDLSEDERSRLRRLIRDKLSR